MDLRKFGRTKLPPQLPATDPWEQVVVTYLDHLSPESREQFRAPTTVDECLQVLSLHRVRKRRFTRIFEFLQPLISPLKRFEGAIDVIVQTNAGIASPIWGPLRIAITVCFMVVLRLRWYLTDPVVDSHPTYIDP